MTVGIGELGNTRFCRKRACRGSDKGIYSLGILDAGSPLVALARLRRKQKLVT